MPVPVTALAMPVTPVPPRRKPRFTLATPFDIEVYPVAVFKQYCYVNDQERVKAPKAVDRVDGGNNIDDWTLYAIARYRAIELANGDGLLSDSSDVEPWHGVALTHPNECRKPPLIWESNT
eukprot:14984437-Heterocapsa_arctica.AAC.1